MIPVLPANPTWAGEPQPSPVPAAPPVEESPSEQIGRTDQPEERPEGPRERRFQDLLFSDDLLVKVQQSRFHLDQALHVSEWLHLGLDFRARDEAYTQPVTKNETTGGEQFSERTSVQVGLRYKPFRFQLEFLEARPPYNYGVTVTRVMEDRHDLLGRPASICRADLSKIVMGPIPMEDVWREG